MEAKESKEEIKEMMKVKGKEKVKLKHMKFRIIKTIVMFLCWIALGLYSEVLGPSLPALRALTHSNNEEIGRALAARSAGMFIGSLFGGLLSDMFMNRRNLFMCITVGSAGILTGIAPMCRSLGLLAFMLFLHGMCHGGLTTSANPSLNALWDERSTGPFSFMHAGYGVGGALGPLILQQFYNPPKSNNTNDVNKLMTSTNNSNILSNQNSTSLMSTSEALYIRKPFIIIGLYCLLISIIFLIYAFLRNPLNINEEPLRIRRKNMIYNVSKKNNRDTYNNDDGGGKIKKRVENILKKLLLQLKNEYKDVKKIITMVIAFVGFFGIVGNERIFGKYQYSYAIEGSLKLSSSYGFLVNGLYWICFTMGRILVALISLKLSPRLLLILEILGAFIASTIMSIWQQNMWVFFFCTAFFGIFKSPLFPTMLGVLSLFGPVTGGLTMIVNFGSSAGASSCQYLMGFLITKYGYFTFPITVAATTFLLLITFIILLVMSRKLRNSNIPASPSSSDKEDDNNKNEAIGETTPITRRSIDKSNETNI